MDDSHKLDPAVERAKKRRLSLSLVKKTKMNTEDPKKSPEKRPAPSVELDPPGGQTSKTALPANPTEEVPKTPQETKQVHPAKKLIPKKKKIGTGVQQRGKGGASTRDNSRGGCKSKRGRSENPPRHQDKEEDPVDDEEETDGEENQHYKKQRNENFRGGNGGRENYPRKYQHGRRENPARHQDQEEDPVDEDEQSDGEENQHYKKQRNENFRGGNRGRENYPRKYQHGRHQDEEEGYWRGNGGARGGENRTRGHWKDRSGRDGTVQEKAARDLESYFNRGLNLVDSTFHKVTNQTGLNLADSIKIRNRVLTATTEFKEYLESTITHNQKKIQARSQ